MKAKFIITTIGVFFCLSFFAHAQQTPSPLINSFRTYKEMKEESKFNLNWVSLGPTLNSARADVVQVDTAHPGTMYVGFGSGGLWKAGFRRGCISRCRWGLSRWM
jgi:hypothetical protein